MAALPGLTVVLNGPSSAGTSSIGRALQARWAGPLQPSGIDTFLGCQSAPFFGDPHRSSGGFDDVWLSQAAADALTAALAGLPVLWVEVRCDPDVLAERERRRGDRTPGQARWQAGRVHRWR